MRDGADAAMRRLARVLVGVFFRRLEVAGASSLPATGPVVVVANHTNGLVDGLVLIAGLRRYPRFLGKSTLWRIVPLRPLLALAGVIPVYRAGESGGRVRQEGNVAAFSAARRLLSSGAVIAVFPEGVSHDEPGVQSLRTGATRIALASGAPVVAAGLAYDDKARFRSSALVRLGPPRWPTASGEDRATVRAFTDLLGADLRAVSPAWESWADAARAMDLAALVTGSDLAARDAGARRLTALAADPATAMRLRSLATDLGELRARAARAGLHLGDLGGSRRGLRARLTSSLVGATLVAPAAAVGVVVHLVPFTIVKMVGSRSANVGMHATVKVAASLGLYVCTYAAIGVAVGRRRGITAGTAAAALAPVTGWCALLAGERLEEIGGLSRVRAGVQRDRAGLSELDRSRAELADRVAVLLGPDAQM